jgi:hypothetical protein
VSRLGNPTKRSVSRRFPSRMVLGVVTVFTGCNIYDSELISSALGPGTKASGGSAGSLPGSGGSGGSAGSGGSSPQTGGNSGVGGAVGGTSAGTSNGGRGGTDASGGSRAVEGGADGEGGDDPGLGGTGGSGGAGGTTAGSDGTSGHSGSGGAGAGVGGGTSGSGGDSAGTGGTGAGGTGGSGSGETCSGCARLEVPLAASGNRAHFTLLLPSDTDMSAATITFRVANVAGTGGNFRGYIQEGAPDYVFQTGNATTIASIGTSMQDIVWSVASAGTAADKTKIRRIGIEISAGSDSSWTNPTVLYVDRITVTGSSPSLASYPFDTDDSVYTTPTGQGPTGDMYLNDDAGDTTVTGAAISWVGP